MFPLSVFYTVTAEGSNQVFCEWSITVTKVVVLLRLVRMLAQGQAGASKGQGRVGLLARDRAIKGYGPRKKTWCL